MSQPARRGRNHGAAARRLISSRQKRLLEELQASVELLSTASSELPPDCQAIQPEQIRTPPVQPSYVETLVRFWMPPEEPEEDDAEAQAATKRGRSNHRSGRERNWDWEGRWWRRRRWLWADYGCGVQMDREGWYSVTPEPLAAHVARRCPPGLLLDAFAGVGGNAVQFARRGHSVLAVDLSEERLALAQHNARVVSSPLRSQIVDGNPTCGDSRHGDCRCDWRGNVDWLCANAVELLASTRPGAFDCIFLAPPWGGEGYGRLPLFSLGTHVPLGPSSNGLELLLRALALAPRVVACLPARLDLAEIAAATPIPFEVERCFVGGSVRFVHLYFGQGFFPPS